MVCCSGVWCQCSVMARCGLTSYGALLLLLSQYWRYIVQRQTRKRGRKKRSLHTTLEKGNVYRGCHTNHLKCGRSFDPYIGYWYIESQGAINLINYDGFELSKQAEEMTSSPLQNNNTIM